MQQMLAGGERITARSGAEPTSSSGSGEAPKKRRGRPPKAAAGGPPPLKELPPGFMEQRRAANPRDHPEDGGDVEYA